MVNSSELLSFTNTAVRSRKYVMPRKRIAGIIAGTPVDTRMGADFIRALGWQCKHFALSPSAEAQHALQLENSRWLQALVEEKIDQMASQGVAFVVIYCHSLSSALDRDRLRRTMPVPVIMPLDAYRDVAQDYDCLAVLAANELGLAGARQVLIRENPSLRVVGEHSMELVHRVEAAESVATIVASAPMQSFINRAKHEGAQGILLACTHFPCLSDELRRQVTIAVRDINDELRRVILPAHDRNR